MQSFKTVLTCLFFHLRVVHNSMAMFTHMNLCVRVWYCMLYEQLEPAIHILPTRMCIDIHIKYIHYIIQYNKTIHKYVTEL